MTIETSDPRLTAHALGELDAQQLATFEAELAGDALAQAEIQAIRETAALLERELSAPSGLELGRAHLAQLEQALEAAGPAAPRKPRRKRWWAAAALAAALPVLGLALVNYPASFERGKGSSSALDESWQRGSVAQPLALPAASAAGRYLSPEDDEDGAFEPSREGYAGLEDNPFVSVARDSRSTFSVDVDTAAYALVRRFLNEGRLPPRDAVRVEELINYFSYSYPEPRGREPFSLGADVAAAPWAPGHRLLRIGLKAREVSQSARPASNLVFLIDVSGSMNEPNKLPLVKDGLRGLLRRLDSRDRVAIVVYAGASGLVLEPTRGDDSHEIEDALSRLQAGGSTNGGSGIQLAYATAARGFVPGGVNRVILATDGDFNVGITDQSDLVDLIQRKAQSGVFLSVLGFGGESYQDATLEKLADKGNGNYAYIDSLAEARKVLVEQAAGTLITVAKDVKIQLEFDPRVVESFRLIGYENRMLRHRDFDDDRKDAGEIGAGHTVTALYELVPARAAAQADDRELCHIDLRYKLPEGERSESMSLSVRDEVRRLSHDFRFAAAVAELGLLLRESPYRAAASYDSVLTLAEGAIGSGSDRQARREFIDLVREAQRLSREPNKTP